MPQETPRQIYGNCPECGTQRWAEIKTSYHDTVPDDDSPVYTARTFRVLQCAGCRTVYFQKTSSFSEDSYGANDPVSGEEIIVYPEKSEFCPSNSTDPFIEQRAMPVWRANFKGKTQLKLGELLDELYAAPLCPNYAVHHLLLVQAAPSPY